MIRAADKFRAAGRFRAPRSAGGPPRVGICAQVAALLSLRIAALRGPTRIRSAFGLASALAVVVAAPLVGVLLPRGPLGRFDVLLPTAWTLFALSSAIASATGAGGRQLISREQGLAFPISPGADHCGAILLTPLNVSWLAQVAALLASTAWLIGPRPGVALALLFTLAWIVAATVLGQAVGWLVELTRTTRLGLLLLRAALTAAVTGIVLVALTGRLPWVLDRLPTTALVLTAISGAHGHLAGWSVDLAGLILLTAAAWSLGAVLLGRLQRRPPLVQARAESRSYPRRPVSRTMLAAALRVDRAGVWRSAPLRRGIATLIVIPGAAVAASGIAWRLIPLLPGLVAAGAGLLFGVNAMALDGAGALWRDTLPAEPRLHLGARLVVVAETCLAGAALVAALGALGAPRAPSAAELTAVLGAVLTTSAQVVARCALWSVRRPYAAELRAARDQPAPPAAMAGYATRLAVSTTLLGLVFGWLAVLGSVPATLLITAGALLLSARRVVTVLNLWQDPVVRSGVLSTVTGG